MMMENERLMQYKTETVVVVHYVHEENTLKNIAQHNRHLIVKLVPLSNHHISQVWQAHCYYSVVLKTSLPLHSTFLHFHCFQ